MVNGPRPAKLFTPASSVSPASGPINGMSPARSPLSLQRQHTSIYSTASTSTPMLIYGKAATPLAGAWSAEPWDTGMMRAAPLCEELETPTVQPHDVDAHGEDDARTCTDDVSSVAETAMPRQETARPQHHLDANIDTATVAETASHVSFVYRHDPYSLVPRREVFRCECHDCFEAATLGSDRLVAGGYAAPDMGEALNSDEYAATFDAFDDGMSNTSPSIGAYAYDDAAALPSWNMPTAAPSQSAFIPPPPPPKITRGVMAESSEANLDVDAAFYHIAMRWYTKVAAVESNFLAAADLCPAPSENRPFDDWVQDAGKWWLRHFEHAQVKTSASSGLLRTATVPLNARPTGFETHASLSAAYSSHKYALRSGPRKEHGTSGLTASMLQSLGGNAAQATPPSMPTPRSWRQELPW